MTIKKLNSTEVPVIDNIINQAARVYQHVIPDDCYHEPYMSRDELTAEMAGMAFYGWDEGGQIVAIMGSQTVKDVTLVRHAYVLPAYQRRGIATKLLDHVKHMTKTRRLLVGTWADAYWAVSFYQKHGFEIMPGKDRLLAEYWTVPRRQLEVSVVLGIQM